MSSSSLSSIFASGSRSACAFSEAGLSIWAMSQDDSDQYMALSVDGPFFDVHQLFYRVFKLSE